ncbi:MAG: hypothetical protein GC151_20070 [Betaproteobacteria bacterium]|nr:hypothetical protein [Betaproteobacteria bacterium]
MTGIEAVSHSIRSHHWLYPAIQIAHLWGVVVVAGAAVLFDLRVLGVFRATTLDALARQLLPWCLIGLMILAPAGMVLFAADPLTLLSNRAFRLKMLLLFAITINALVFHFGPAGNSLAPGSTESSGVARFQALVSLTLWFAVIALGRLIAYV